MDLFPLDSDTYYPTTLFEEYSSLIWTERFGAFGEFQLVSANIDETISAFPLGALVSLRDTTEVMMVETHSIEPNSSDGIPEITVSGRTLDSFLENRALLPTYKKYGQDWNLLQTYTPQQMICLLIWNALVNDSGEDPTRAYNVYQPFDLDLVVPNLVVSLGPVLPAEKISWALSAGVVSDVMVDIQNAHKIGVRSIRPITDSNQHYDRVSFDVTRTLAQRGVFHLDPVSNDTQNMRFEVYQGIDRTIHQDAVTPVIFHHASGHIANPKYLRSSKSLKSYAAVASSMGNYYIPHDYVTGSGFNRRVLFIDGGDKGSVGLTTQAELELKKNTVIAMADGDISPSSPYLFGRDYFLGDTITFSGNYEQETSMFINEMVRTDDMNGETVSPGIINYSEIAVDDGEVIIG